MTITSKYDSTCKKCNGQIKQGQQIDWSKETGPRHISCPAVTSLHPAFMSGTANAGRARASAGHACPARAAKPADDPRRPYGGKFQRAKETYDHAAAAVGAAELDAEHRAVTGPTPADPLARISAYLGKLAPLDGLRIAAGLLQAQQKRVDNLYRKAGAAA